MKPEAKNNTEMYVWIVIIFTMAAVSLILSGCYYRMYDKRKIQEADNFVQGVITSSSQVHSGQHCDKVLDPNETLICQTVDQARNAHSILQQELK